MRLIQTRKGKRLLINREMPNVQILGAIYPDEDLVISQMMADGVSVDGQTMMSRRMLVRAALRRLAEELRYKMPPEFSHDKVVMELPNG